MSIKPPASHRTPTERLVILALRAAPEGLTATELQVRTGSAETALANACRLLLREGVVTKTFAGDYNRYHLTISEVAL